MLIDFILRLAMAHIWWITISNRPAVYGKPVLGTGIHMTCFCLSTAKIRPIPSSLSLSLARVAFIPFTHNCLYIKSLPSSCGIMASQTLPCASLGNPGIGVVSLFFSFFFFLLLFFGFAFVVFF